MVDKKFLRDFRIALVQNDEPLDPTDERYVPHLHGSDEEDVVSAMLEEILARPTQGSELVYFTGQRGTGKSTELRRLEVNLNGEGAQVVRFDCLDFMGPTIKITVESLLLLVTAGLADYAGNGKFKDRFLKDRAWTRFSDWLNTEVKLTEVSVKGLKLVIKDQQPRIAEQVRALASGIEWTKKIAEFAGEIVEFVRQTSGRERIVVIVDSLEHLRGVSVNDLDDMFAHMTAAFAGNFDRLRIPGATVVYSTPPYLALLADVRNYVACYSLASVRVYAKPAKGQTAEQRRQPRPEGLRLLRDLIRRRFAGWDEVLRAETLDAAALASGGDLRHFMHRLVADAVGQAQSAIGRLPLKLDDPIVQRVLDENRGETERLTVRSEWPLLKSITESNNAIALDRGESLRTMARLFETRVILNYRNGAEWFDIHPLLWPLIDAQASDAAKPGA
jgi:AAA ATPase domain